MIDLVYVGDLGAVIIPGEYADAAGYAPFRRTHWRVKRRLDQVGRWLYEAKYG